MQGQTDRPIAQTQEIVLAASRSDKLIGLPLARAILHSAAPRTPSLEEPPRTRSREGWLTDPLIAHEHASVVVTVEVSVSQGEVSEAEASEAEGSGVGADGDPTSDLSTTLFFSPDSTTALASIASPITVATSST